MAWTTVSVTALAPGIVVTCSDGGEYHALALLHQHNDDPAIEDRIKLGILNTAQGTVEPVLNGRLVDIDVSRWWVSRTDERRPTRPHCGPSETGLRLAGGRTAPRRPI